MDKYGYSLLSSNALRQIDLWIAILIYTLLKDTLDNTFGTFNLTFLADVILNAALKARQSMNRFPDFVVYEVHLPQDIRVHNL